MDDRYRDEVFLDWDFNNATECAIKGCPDGTDADWYIWITIHGRSKKLRFCAKHGLEENQYEREYELGL